MKSHNFFFAFLISKAYLYYLVYHPDRFIFMCMSVSTMPCLISQCSMQQHIYIFFHCCSPILFIGSGSCQVATVECANKMSIESCRMGNVTKVSSA